MKESVTKPVSEEDIKKSDIELIQDAINEQINLGNTHLCIGILVDNDGKISTFWNGGPKLSTILGALESCRFDIYEQMFSTYYVEKNK